MPNTPVQTCKPWLSSATKYQSCEPNATMQYPWDGGTEAIRAPGARWRGWTVTLQSRSTGAMPSPETKRSWQSSLLLAPAAWSRACFAARVPLAEASGQRGAAPYGADLAEMERPRGEASLPPRSPADRSSCPCPSASPAPPRRAKGRDPAWCHGSARNAPGHPCLSPVRREVCGLLGGTEH